MSFGIITWNRNKKSKTILYERRQLHSTHKTKFIYAGIINDVETRYGTSNYELDKPQQKGKDKNVIGVMKMN